MIRAALVAATAAAVLVPASARAENVSRDPEWSPDGARIAFVSDEAHRARDAFLSADVWVMDADGGKQRNLTRDRRRDARPRWSHDGQLLAYGSYLPTDGWQLRILPAGGGAPRVVAEMAAGGYDWSPAERRLAYVDRDGVIRTVDAQTGEARLLVAGTNPEWSPDGRRVAFARDGRIWLVAADGRDPRPLTSGPRDAGAAWSADGRTIAFASGRDGYANLEIYVVDVVGTAERRLTFNDRQLADFEGSSLDIDPVWSPEGGELAFTSGRGGSFDIWAIRPDGGGLRRITATRRTHEEQDPAWSPDGTRIAFEIERPYWTFDDDIGVVERDGSGRRNLTFTRGLVLIPGRPRFSRDRRWLLARVTVADSAATRRRGALVTVRGDGIAPKTRRTSRLGLAVFLLRVPPRGTITLIFDARSAGSRGRLTDRPRLAFP